jgi:ankyrin repeat protein
LSSVRLITALLLTALLPPAMPALAAGDARAAIARALPILQRSAATFVARRACLSCHHNVLPVMALRLADRHGMTVDAAVLKEVETRTFRALRGPDAIDEAIQGATLSDPTPNDSFLLMAAHEAGVAGDLTTAAYARRLARWQQPDGRWVTSDFRPPHSSSQFTATASAVQALRAYMPPELAAERDAVIGRAASWLASAWPRSTEDAAFRVLGLVWAGASAEAIDAAARTLLTMQLPAGGWPELPAYAAADAYSTGEALYALRASGMPPDRRAWQRGERFLIATQAHDGTWRVPTRMISPAEVSPPYFRTGFPYGKDEFISYAGSCWAVMALLSSLPDRPATIPPPPPGAAPESPSWLRTALFASTRDLVAALDAGLDPNSRTAGGTTLLMAAALDPDKTRALLARGADPRVRGRSGIDALTIAASHVAAVNSVTALLDAGAEPQPPDGVRARRTAIVAASMTGDLETVRLLLRRGAAPSSEAAAEAVTFGHAEVVRALIEAGADVQGVDRAGINLLHWAAITNRPPVIPILVKAGVPIDAVDESGFTPLMYAATIDQGDNDTVQALLREGADRNVRNATGRTALEQARHLRHTEIVRALTIPNALHESRRTPGVASHATRGGSERSHGGPEATPPARGTQRAAP